MGGTKAKWREGGIWAKVLRFFFYLKLKYMDEKLSLFLARNLIFPFCYSAI